MADKYGVETLKALALSHLENDCLYIYPAYVPGFVAAVQWIYENTKEGDPARRVIILKTVRNLDRLLWNKEVEFSIMMASLGEFGRDVARAVCCCTEFGLWKRHFHARSSTRKDTAPKATSQDEYDDDEEDVYESETSSNATPLTAYRCKH